MIPLKLQPRFMVVFLLPFALPPAAQGKGYQWPARIQELLNPSSRVEAGRGLEYGPFMQGGLLSNRYGSQSSFFPSFHPSLSTIYKRSLNNNRHWKQFRGAHRRPMGRFRRSVYSFGSGGSNRWYRGDQMADAARYLAYREKRGGGARGLPAGLANERETAHQIKDCMTVGTEEGQWFFRSEGDDATCGLYLVAGPEYLIEVTLEDNDVDCKDGLIMLFDGWELNRNVFPAAADHPLGMDQRSTLICNGNEGKKMMVSSQNAALVSFRVPRTGQGFVLSVKFIPNHDPCNILMSEMAGFFTISNNGQARNCTLTTLLFPANIAVMSLQVGEQLRQRRSIDDGGIFTQCSQRGSQDFVEMGGASDLDSTHLVTSETLCGYQTQPAEKGLTVLCSSSTVRLVSSGNYDNSVSVFVKVASDEDIDFDSNLVMACPENE